MEVMTKSRNSSSNSLVGCMEPTPTTTTEETKVGKKRKAGSSSKNQDVGGDNDQSEQQVHIWTERERRKRMRTMFTNLQALLPQLPSKADKSSVVDEAITYIKTLQQTLQTLEKQKLEKLRGGGIIIDSEPSSAVSVISASEPTREAFLASQGPSKLSTSNTTNAPLAAAAAAPSGFQTWFSPNVVLNMCGDDAHICVCSVKKQGLFSTILHILEKHSLDVVSVHVSTHHHNHSCTYMIHVQAGARCSSQFPESLSAEDTFKLAAGEMNLWLLSC